MGKGTRAAIYIHLLALASREQQERYVTRYCELHQLEPSTIVFHPDDALRLVKEGFVDVIVCAYLPRDRLDLADRVRRAGGKLMTARPSSIFKQDFGQMIAKLWRRGMTISEIADVTDSPTGEIRLQLRNRGLGG